jgi:hypothetical protein
MNNLGEDIDDLAQDIEAPVEARRLPLWLMAG